MRTDRVVLFQPIFGDVTNLLKIIKQIGIQNIFPKRSVEALDVSILRRFSRLDMQQFNLFFFGPALQSLGDQLRTIIHSYPGWPRQSSNCSRTLTTRSAGSEVSTSIQSASRL